MRRDPVKPTTTEENQNAHRPGREDSAQEAVLATTGPGTRQRFEGVPDRGLQPAALLRALPQLTGAARRGADRSIARREGAASETASYHRSRRPSWPKRSSIRPTASRPATSDCSGWRRRSPRARSSSPASAPKRLSAELLADYFAPPPDIRPSVGSWALARLVGSPIFKLLR